MSTPSENRLVQRISTERPVDIHHINGHHDDTNPSDAVGKMIDLSIAGTGILTQSPVNQDETLCLDFKLPNLPQAISLCGIAKHAYKIRDQYLIGVEFKDISDYTQTQIKEYITYHNRLNT